MPKAAPAKNQEKQVTEAAFLKSLNAHETVAKESAKKERPSGILTDHEILDMLGLAPGDSGIFEAQVNKITFGFAKNDPNRPMFRFVYSIVSDDKRKNGLIVSNTHILEEMKSKTAGADPIRTKEQAIDGLFFELQGLGEDTEAYIAQAAKRKVGVLAIAHEACKLHTRDKTPVTLSIRHWVSETSKNEDGSPKTGMNIRVQGPLADSDNSDLDEQIEETETNETATTETEGGDEFVGADWVDVWIEYPNEEFATRDGGIVRAKVTAYNEDTDTFDLIDENGEEWTGEYALATTRDDWYESGEQE